MRNDTKLFKLLKYFYLNKEKKIRSKELVDATGIKLKHINTYTKRINNRINREIINGKIYYQIKPDQVNYIGKKLSEAIGDEERDKLD